MRRTNAQMTREKKIAARAESGPTGRACDPGVARLEGASGIVWGSSFHPMRWITESPVPWAVFLGLLLAFASQRPHITSRVSSFVSSTAPIDGLPNDLVDPRTIPGGANKDDIAIVVTDGAPAARDSERRASGPKRTREALYAGQDWYRCHDAGQPLPYSRGQSLGLRRSVSASGDVAEAHVFALPIASLPFVTVVTLLVEGSCSDRDITSKNAWLNFRDSHYPPGLRRLVVVDLAPKPFNMFQELAVENGSGGFGIDYLHLPGHNVVSSIKAAMDKAKSGLGRDGVMIFMHASSIYSPGYIHLMASMLRGAAPIRGDTPDKGSTAVAVAVTDRVKTAQVDVEGSIHMVETIASGASTDRGCRVAVTGEEGGFSDHSRCQYAIDLVSFRDRQCDLTAGGESAGLDTLITCHGDGVGATPVVTHAVVSGAAAGVGGPGVISVANTPRVRCLFNWKRQMVVFRRGAAVLDSCPTAVHRHAFYNTVHELMTPFCVEPDPKAAFERIDEATRGRPATPDWIRAVHEPRTWKDEGLFP